MDWTARDFVELLAERVGTSWGGINKEIAGAYIKRWLTEDDRDPRRIDSMVTKYHPPKGTHPSRHFIGMRNELHASTLSNDAPSLEVSNDHLELLPPHLLKDFTRGRKRPEEVLREADLLPSAKAPQTTARS